MTQIATSVLPVQSVSPASLGDGAFRYIDIASIDREKKTIVNPALIDNLEAPSRARQLVKPNDVLVSTVRPNLNAVAFVPGELDGAIASTGFTVLRPDLGKLDSRYLYHWVRTERFVDEMTRLATGASYPAVSDAIVKRSEMPLPPLEEQRRIAEVLDRADALRQKRRLAIQKLDAVLESVFLNTFGDPVANPRGWAVVPMLSITNEFRYGTSNKSGSSGFPALRIPNVVNQMIDLADLKTVEVTKDDFERLRLLEGDVLFVRTNGNPDYVGRCAVFEPEELVSSGYSVDEFIYASYLIRARLNKSAIEPLYLQGYLLTQEGRNSLRSKCKTSAGQFNINTEGLGSVHLPLPGIELQQEYVKATRKVRAYRKLYDRQFEQFNALFSSIQHRAFKGELFQEDK